MCTYLLRVVVAVIAVLLRVIVDGGHVGHAAAARVFVGAAYKCNMIIDSTFYVRSDLRGCLETTVASKLHFLCWSPIDGSS